MRRRVTRRNISWAWLGLLAASCGNAPSDSAGPYPASSTIVPLFTYTLPADYQPPSSLAGDPSGDGAWFLSGSDKVTAILFASSTPSKDRNYPLQKSLVLGADSGIAIAPDGTVWAGAQQTLVHLVPATGALTEYAVPTPSDSASAESYRPTSVQGTHDIVSIAVSNSGSVAIAQSAAAQVTVLRNGTFSSWPLPANTAPVDVAYLEDGTLGVGLADYATHHVDKVATFSQAGGRALTEGVAGSHMVGHGDRFLTVTDHIIAIDNQARVAATVSLSSATNHAQPITVRPITVLPSGNIAEPSTDGVLLANVSNGQTTDERLPMGPCVPSSAALPPGVTTPASPASCPSSPLLVAADGSHNLWLVLPQRQNEIAVVAGVDY